MNVERIIEALEAAWAGIDMNTHAEDEMVRQGVRIAALHLAERCPNPADGLRIMEWLKGKTGA